jgi:ABC-type dipeptide/oligopeptide/nickel transport system permease component
VGAFVLKRLLTLVPTFFGLTILVFCLVKLIPGDPALVMLGEHATPEAVKQLRAEMGLDRPVTTQYFTYIGHVLQGDFGRSIRTRERINVEIAEKFTATMELAVIALFIACVIGIVAGVVSAVRQYSAFDHISMVGALVGVSMPIFWLALILIWFFGVSLEWLPVSGRLSVEHDVDAVTGIYMLDTLIQGNWEIFWDLVKHIALPAVALSTIPMAIIARITRSSMLEVLRNDYIRTAQAKGLNEFTVVMKHAFTNALIPLITVIGLQFGRLLGGAVITETIFAWPGIGRWVLEAVFARDFPAIQGGVLVVAMSFVIINMIIDILYGVIDPRIRRS